MEIEIGEFKITAPYEKYILKHIMKNPFEEYKRFMKKLVKMGEAIKSEEQTQ